MKRIKLGLRWLVTLTIISGLMLPFYSALASYAVNISLNNTTATSYAAVALGVDTHNSTLVASGNMSANGLDAQVRNGSGFSVPRMLADNNTWFVGAAAASTAPTYSFTTGNTADNFSIVVGDGGYVFTPGNDTNLHLTGDWYVRYDGYVNTDNVATLVTQDYGVTLATNGAGNVTANLIYLAGFNDDEIGLSFNNVTDNGTALTSGDILAGETFTTGNATHGYQITSLNFYIGTYGSPVGDFVFNLTDTAGGEPNNSLFSEALAISSFIPGNLQTVNLTSPLVLEPNTLYATFGYATAGNATDYLTMNGLTAGTASFDQILSVDAGSTWSFPAGDLFFKVLGMPIEEVNLSTAVVTGDHIIQVESNGGDFNLLVDSIVQDTATPAIYNGLPNFSSDLYWMGVFAPYANRLSVFATGEGLGSNLRLDYEVSDIVTVDTIIDQSGFGNDGEINWGINPFSVSLAAASVMTLPATNIQATSASLNGVLLAMGTEPSFSTYFEYGITTSYGSTTPLVPTTVATYIAANVVGLTSGVTYHFRAVAAGATSTIYGSDLTFVPSVAGGLVQFGGGNARVFKNYLADNDTLVTAEIVNTYTPYYPNQSPKEYFSIQLIDTDNTTILAATPQQDWGDKPIGIYINPTQSARLTNGANYYVRIQGNFAANVTAQYQLQHLPWNNDWKGSDLTKLDDWAVYVAMNMQTFYSGGGYVTVLTDRKLAITDAVGGYFTAGIAGIGQVRPNLFTTSQQTPTFTAGISALPADNTTAYTAYVGSTIANDANDLGVPFGMTGRDMLAAGLALAMLGVIMTGTAAMGGFGALGLFLISIPILWLGTYFKIVGVQYIMVLTIIFGFLFVRQFWIKTT